MGVRGKPGWLDGTLRTPPRLLSSRALNLPAPRETQARRCHRLLLAAIRTGLLPLHRDPPRTAKMGTREASHAGSWYEEDAEELSSQLDRFLDRVPTTLDDTQLPIQGARVIIAP